MIDKKTTMLLLIFLATVMCMPISNGIYGGESVSLFIFDKCKDLSIQVNGSSPIQDGEYSLNCGDNMNNSWNCNCTDGFDLLLNTSKNTLNQYTITIDHGYEQIVIISPSGGSGGSSRSIVRRYDENETTAEQTAAEEDDNETETLSAGTGEFVFNPDNLDDFQDAEPGTDNQVNNLITGQVTDTEFSFERGPFVLGGLFLVAAAAGAWFLFFRKK